MIEGDDSLAENEDCRFEYVVKDNTSKDQNQSPNI